ncbi:MAG TPA: zinc ribbon domain-containing protein [Bryobacteraceae bacterium]|nr:zinc ribbon domain-containing protein [Bryobacteraceae bacterium]
MTEIQQPSINKPRERIRFRRREKLRFSDEVRLIPREVASTVAGLYLTILAIVMALNWNSARPPVWVMVAALTAVSIVVAAYVFLVAYINRDAKRRGMSPTLWTLLVIFLPGSPVSGSIIYFLVRKPLPFHCPQCGSTVLADFNFCPQCKRNLRPACPHCGQEIGESDRYCPNCAWELASPAEP